MPMELRTAHTRLPSARLWEKLTFWREIVVENIGCTSEDELPGQL